MRGVPAAVSWTGSDIQGASVGTTLPAGATADATGVLQDSIDFLVGAAVRAPSVHNTQPWRFRIRGGAIEVIADRTRLLTSVDPEGRELVMSCGAALFNLRLAVGHLGYTPRVAELPDAADTDLLARLSVGPVRTPDMEEERLLAAVHRRHTHRGAFDPKPVPRQVLFELQEAAEVEGAELHLVEQVGGRHALARLLELADEQQLADPAYRAEISAWTPAPDDAAREGVPASAYPRQAPPPTPGSLPARDFSLGRGWGTADASAGAEEEPTVAVLVTGGDRAADWLRAGQALQRVLLVAATHWLFASFLGQPVEVRHLRAALRTELRLDGFAQHVMRFGYAGHAASTPRRPVTEVLDAQSAREADSRTRAAL